MTEEAKKLGNMPINSEMFFGQNNESETTCAFEVRTYSGLTKREYYAGLAMQGIIASKQYLFPANVAEQAILQADALLEELSKE
jgi:hypothetical protein